MKVLFIAFYFEPFNGVGTKRISYWAENLNTIASDIFVDVVTATKGSIPIPNGKVFHIENKGTGVWTKLFKTDIGASWGYNLKKWLEQHGRNYDIILFTGGPFLHFRVASWIKKNTSAKVIFDYRDPMSVNPRNKNRKISLKLKNIIMRMIERFFNQKADSIISVNEWCFSLIQGVKNQKKFIIDNGFDESVLQKIKMNFKNNLSISKKIRFVYAGKFSDDRNPKTFFDVIKNDDYLKKKIEFIYIGDESSFLQAYKGQDWLIELGKKSYTDTLSILNECDYGSIFTIGHPFESTTKIFDYIGMGLKIIIIADKIAIHGALKEYSGVYQNIEWVKNNYNDISIFLKNNINRLKTKSEINYEFSRRAGIMKLNAALRETINC